MLMFGALSMQRLAIGEFLEFQPVLPACKRRKSKSPLLQQSKVYGSIKRISILSFFSHLICIEIKVKSDLHDGHLLVELDVDEVGLSAV